MAKQTDVSEILERAQEEIDIFDQVELDGWLTNEGSQKLTAGKKKLSNSILIRAAADQDIRELDLKDAGRVRQDLVQNLIPKARDEVDPYFDKRDLTGLKKERFVDTDLQEIRDNQFYNLAATMYREARDSKDVGALESLRETIQGTVAKGDWTPQIDKTIERIRR